MRKVLFLGGLTLLYSCSLTISRSTYATDDLNVVTIEAVGNFMANGHKNKVVVHPECVSVYPISNIVDSRTMIEIPFQTWCGGPDDYMLRTHRWSTPIDEFGCDVSEARKASIAGKQKS